MYLNSEMKLKLAKIYVDSSKVYLNLRNCIIKFGNSDTDLLKFGKNFPEY